MSEIIEALNQLEKERNISKDVLLEAIAVSYTHLDVYKRQEDRASCRW